MWIMFFIAMSFSLLNRVFQFVMIHGERNTSIDLITFDACLPFLLLIFRDAADFI